MAPVLDPTGPSDLLNQVEGAPGPPQSGTGDGSGRVKPAEVGDHGPRHPQLDNARYKTRGTRR